MAQLGAAALPVLIGLILLYGFGKGVPVFDTFLVGAKEGMISSYKILPTLIGLIIAVSMLRASGVLELLCGALAPLTQAIGLPSEIIPLALLRPVSGSGSSAYTLSLFQSYGPDSEIGKIASVLSSSTETTFYAIAVYFGACQCKKLSYAVPAALLGDMVAIVFSVLTVRVFS